jgi:hypothetical protein
LITVGRIEIDLFGALQISQPFFENRERLSVLVPWYCSIRVASQHAAQPPFLFDEAATTGF